MAKWQEENVALRAKILEVKAALVQVLAALDGLTHLITVEQAAKERGVDVSAIGYRSRAKSRTETHDARKAAVVGASPNAAEVA